MKSRIDSLQVVRAFAFLAIFVHHSGITIFDAGGAWGVSVFLILSGFLMYCSYAGTGRIKESGIEYSIKFGMYKVKRLYPLHIVTLVLAMPFLIVAYIDYPGMGRILNPVIKIVGNVFLVQSWIPNKGIYFSLNAVSWYLSVSLFLYIMFPFILGKMKKYKGIKIAVCVIAIVFLLQVIAAYLSYCVQINMVQNDDFIHWFTYIFPLSRLEDFVIGCNLGYVYKNVKRDNAVNIKRYTFFEIAIFVTIIIQWAVYVLLISAPAEYTLSIRFGNWWGLSAFWTITSSSLVYIFAVNGGKISRVLTNRILVFIGDMSANAFLIHQMVYRYLELPEKWLGEGTAANTSLC